MYLYKLYYVVNRGPQYTETLKNVVKQYDDYKVETFKNKVNIYVRTNKKIKPIVLILDQSYALWA